MAKRKSSPKEDIDTKPKIFIVSSSEGLDIANNLQVALQDLKFCHSEVWNQDNASIGRILLNKLIENARTFDFAVVVFTPDDFTNVRRKNFFAPRDNVLFELGLFMGTLGEKRVFIVHRQQNPPKIPSDFDGVLRAVYDAQHPNLRAALNIPALKIRDTLNTLANKGKPRDDFAKAIQIIINHYPAGITEEDLALFQGYEVITDNEYIILRDMLQKKIMENMAK